MGLLVVFDADGIALGEVEDVGPVGETLAGMELMPGSASGVALFPPEDRESRKTAMTDTATMAIVERNLLGMC